MLWLLLGTTLSPFRRQPRTQAVVSQYQLRLFASAWISQHQPLCRISRGEFRASPRATLLLTTGLAASPGQSCGSSSASPPLNTTASRNHSVWETIRLTDGAGTASLSIPLGEEDWRDAPELNPRIDFPTAIVPPNVIHRLVRDPATQPFLASALWTEMGHVQRRLRIVQDIDSFDVSSGAIADQNLSSKLLLLHPNVVNDPESRQKWQDAFQFVASQQHSELSASTATTTLVYGPSVSVRLRPKDYTVSYVLSKLLPAEIGMPPTSFETVGHVAHLNLPETFMPHRHLIGEVLLECLSSSSLIRTVICKTDSVAGPYRTYDFEIVAGDPTTVVRHVEHGVNLFFDVQKVYWSSRLSQERKRLVSAFRPGQVIADAFCGVGALCLQASKLGCVVLANDWNPDAIESLQRNARRNRAKLSDVRCGDAYEFLMDLGLSSGGDLPDHVVMNYPLEAPRFLGALRWWRPSSTNHDSARTGGGPRLHVYTFARAEGSRTAEDEAVEAISSHLVYGPTPNSEGTRLSRAAELEEYGCNIHVHFVRDVAPGKKVFCVSFTATPKLLRYMQGDFS